MHDLQDFKTFLGPIAAVYTDDQLRLLCRDLYNAADLLLDLYFESNDTHANRTLDASFDNSRTHPIRSGATIEAAPKGGSRRRKPTT